MVEHSGTVLTPGDLLATVITGVRGSHAAYISQPEAVADAVDAAARTLP
jgi:hypothetical protein